MRGDSAGQTADQPNPATPANLLELTPPATLHRRCTRCGSPFAQDFEEARCSNCIAWLELLGGR